MDAERLSASLRGLADRDLAQAGIHQALQQVADACVAIFGVTGSGVMLADDQNITRYVAASDGPGRILETAESETAQGPCTQAFVDVVPVDSPDVLADDRWPDLAVAVADHGVRAVLGVPVRLGGVVVGTLDVYRDHVQEWTEEERAGLLRYADVTSRTLAALLQAHQAGELAAQLQYALDHRIVVERGVGYLMASRGVDAVTAFTLLRTAARRDRRKIGEVATEVLMGRPLAVVGG